MSSRLGLRYREGFVKSRYICFFFNNPAPTELYTLSLHDALPILSQHIRALEDELSGAVVTRLPHGAALTPAGRSLLPEARSEEHTSELQSRRDLVCRLLLEKKKKCKTSREIVMMAREAGAAKVRS